MIPTLAPASGANGLLNELDDARAITCLPSGQVFSG